MKNMIQEKKKNQSKTRHCLHKKNRKKKAGPDDYVEEKCGIQGIQVPG